jgi:hypothetical protein
MLGPRGMQLAAAISAGAADVVGGRTQARSSEAARRLPGPGVTRCAVPPQFDSCDSEECAVQAQTAHCRPCVTEIVLQ